MQLLRDISDIEMTARGSVMALGNFDGLHVGHQQILHTTRKLADARGVPTALMTFEPHPRRLFRPELPPLRILPLAEKLRALEKAGVDFILMQRFTHDFSGMTAEQFITDLLVRKLAVSGIVTGSNFCFGHQRGGNAAFLKAAAKKHGFHYEAVSPLKVAGDRCSSTRLRGALASGDMELAEALLGRPYYLTGRIQRGDQRGRKLGFPTANLHPSPGLFHAAFGIYAVTLKVANDSTSYPGVANFGIRPMYRVKHPLLETHLFDVSPNLYGQNVSVSLHHFIRSEAEFTSEAALIDQMEQDKTQARQYFRNHPPQ